jgi:hypothetical protein
MQVSRFSSSFGKACALVAVTLILPILAYAQQNSQGGGSGNQAGNNQGGHPVVPETNAGWVLVPFFGAILLYSVRRLRAKA